MSSPRRGHQQLDALIKIGEGMDRKLTQEQIDLAHAMATMMARQRGHRDTHPEMESAAKLTLRHFAELSKMLERHIQENDLEYLYALAMVFTESQLYTPPLRNPPRRKKRLLSTAEQVVRAIAECVTDIDAGDVTPQAGRARLHGLQTLLVAMRMRNESAGLGPLPELKAGEELPPRDLDAELRHLQHTTAEDLG